MNIEDRRKDKTTRPAGYMVATDSFLSGWGGANGGRSLYAVACHSWQDADAVAQNMKDRTDMKRPRWITAMRKDGTPIVRGTDRDHLAVVDRGRAEAFYVPGHFAAAAAERRNRELAGI